MSLNPDAKLKISQCVDEVLETLGKRGKQALIRYLEIDIGLKTEEIPQKPELFRKGLNLIFGEQAAGLLETEIVQKLQTSLGLDPKSKLTLAETIKIIKGQETC
jgi:hypothetical protein